MTKSRKLDIILIVSLILLSAIALLCLFVFKQDGKSVEVRVNGEVVAVYSLDNDGEHELNGGTNILVIKDGTAYISQAGCPDKTCTRAGRLTHVGQSAVCLPNRLSVTVVGESADGVELVG